MKNVEGLKLTLCGEREIVMTRGFASCSCAIARDYKEFFLLKLDVR
jgi:hypothetical protein